MLRRTSNGEGLGCLAPRVEGDRSQSWLTRWPRLAEGSEQVTAYRKIYTEEWLKKLQAFKKVKSKDDGHVIQMGPFRGKTVADTRLALASAKEEILQRKSQLEAEIKVLLQKKVDHKTKAAAACNKEVSKQLGRIIETANSAVGILSKQHCDLQMIEEANADAPANTDAMPIATTNAPASTDAMQIATTNAPTSTNAIDIPIPKDDEEETMWI